MSRLPRLAIAAALVLGGIGGTAAQADPTICVDDICVCAASSCIVEPILSVEEHCVKADLDGDGDYETICT